MILICLLSMYSLRLGYQGLVWLYMYLSSSRLMLKIVSCTVKQSKSRRNTVDHTARIVPGKNLMIISSLLTQYIDVSEPLDDWSVVLQLTCEMRVMGARTVILALYVVLEARPGGYSYLHIQGSSDGREMGDWPLKHGRYENYQHMCLRSWGDMSQINYEKKWLTIGR